ncbi:hypothetical protein V6N11_020779 [Hibiscus sabdariffa]|uniref:Uncharacterized protein n=1 Tax=Hibiscus sabdariffa TaxID=183260 RepID=A0ABR2Q9E3_9ROSI
MGAKDRVNGNGIGKDGGKSSSESFVESVRRLGPENAAVDGCLDEVESFNDVLIGKDYNDYVEGTLNLESSQIGERELLGCGSHINRELFFISPICFESDLISIALSIEEEMDACRQRSCWSQLPRDLSPVFLNMSILASMFFVFGPFAALGELQFLYLRNLPLYQSNSTSVELNLLSLSVEETNCAFSIWLRWGSTLGKEAGMFLMGC